MRKFQFDSICGPNIHIPRASVPYVNRARKGELDQLQFYKKEKSDETVNVKKI